MARILIVGNVTLDIINHVERYPREDDEVRALAQERRRGGNAGNTAVVLSQLGHAVHFAGTLADEPDGQTIRADFERHRIDLSAVHTVAEGKVPTSYVALSRTTGSRTIVHMRDLPEYPAARFAGLALEQFDWVHFEGRNLDEVQHMLERVRQEAPSMPISLEAEKPRPGMERLFPLADLLLFSRGYAEHAGHRQGDEFLAAMHQAQPHAELVCGWGAIGAWGCTTAGAGLFAPAAPPARIVDTLGAGDVFNAGIIDSRVRGRALAEALNAAAQLAGRKCGQMGFEGLGN